LDEADCNGQFIKLHFKNKDPAESKFVTTNIYTGGPMIFAMDPKVKIFFCLFNYPLPRVFIEGIYMRSIIEGLENGNTSITSIGGSGLKKLEYMHISV